MSFLGEPGSLGVVSGSLSEAAFLTEAWGEDFCGGEVTPPSFLVGRGLILEEIVEETLMVRLVVPGLL